MRLCKAVVEAPVLLNLLPASVVRKVGLRNSNFNFHSGACTLLHPYCRKIAKIWRVATWNVTKIYIRMILLISCRRT